MTTGIDRYGDTGIPLKEEKLWFNYATAYCLLSIASNMKSSNSYRYMLDDG